MSRSIRQLPIRRERLLNLADTRLAESELEPVCVEVPPAPAPMSPPQKQPAGDATPAAPLAP